MAEYIDVWLSLFEIFILTPKQGFMPIEHFMLSKNVPTDTFGSSKQSEVCQWYSLLTWKIKSIKL